MKTKYLEFHKTHLIATCLWRQNQKSSHSFQLTNHRNRKRLKRFGLQQQEKTNSHTRKSPAWMVPISMDFPISSSSYFTMNSFARPTSFLEAPFATEQISEMQMITKQSTTQSTTRCNIHKITIDQKQDTFHCTRFILLSACNVEASSQDGILISSPN